MIRELTSVVTETETDGELSIWRVPSWSERFPWLFQGTTGAGDPDNPFDLGLFGQARVGEVVERWRRLRVLAGMESAVHARQLHGIDLYRHGDTPPGLLVMEGFDGHLTDRPGVMLAVSVADCVPVFLVDPEHRAIGVLHAGWRGLAGGIVEHAITSMAEEFGSRAAELWLHCGPAICGECYEVGPEVHAALEPGAEPPPGPAPIDMRAVIDRRARAAGITREHLSLSSLCTRCGAGAFFSHRGGSAARQMGVLGLRP